MVYNGEREAPKLTWGFLSQTKIGSIRGGRGSLWLNGGCKGAEGSEFKACEGQWP